MTFPLGYQTDPGFDPAEDHIGPFYFTEQGDRRLYAFKAEQHHCNVTDIVHGGVLMTFADYALCMEATDNYREEDCVTVTFNSEFVNGAIVGQVIEATARVSRKTGSLVFLTGEVFSSDDGKENIILTFSAVVKRLRRE